MRRIKTFSELCEDSNSYKLPEIIRDTRTGTQARTKDLMTEDSDGNYLFYHYSDEKRDQIKPGSGDGGLRTSREESSALSSVGGMAMYYTRQGDKEALVGSVEHVIAVPKNKVYYFNEDALNFLDAAKAGFDKVRPGQAFNANYQLAWITKIANEKGFDIVVARWGGGKAAGFNKYQTPQQEIKLRAQTTLTLKP
jgi:hypothetical protein